MDIQIDQKNSGTRIDKFLIQEVFLNMELTRGEIIRQIKEGRVLVNGKTVKPSYCLKESDKLNVNLINKTAGLSANKNIDLAIIYSDPNIIVLNKPASLQVHPSERSETDTLASGLLAKYPEIKNVGDAPEIRPGIVHRLDKDTSGLMIVARNHDTFLELKRLFQSHQIKKTYWAIVSGSFSGQAKEGLIEVPIARAANYKKQVVAGRKTATKIRPALTRYKILNEAPAYSLVELRPETGRMHQIRVHMKHLGHPVVGDKKYGPKIQAELNTGRHLLHAKSIEFALFGKQFNFETELPEDFQAFLDEKFN